MEYNVNNIFDDLPGRNGFKGSDILKVAQFDRDNLSYIMALASRMRDVVQTRGGFNMLKFKVMTALFYEPSTLSQYEEVKNYYIVDPKLMEQAKEKMIVMHPLPRVGEIHETVDPDPRAAYFRQVRNGLYIRIIGGDVG